ncbi:uncharacterized protein LOC144098086 [Amblyomma americanum]
MRRIYNANFASPLAAERASPTHTPPPSPQNYESAHHCWKGAGLACVLSGPAVFVFVAVPLTLFSTSVRLNHTMAQNLSSELRAGLDIGSNACQSLYAFACGAWSDKQPDFATPDSRHASRIAEAVLRVVLTRRLAKGGSAHKVASHLAACFRPHENRDLLRAFLMRNNLPWPDSAPRKNGSSVLDVLTGISLGNGVPVFLKFSVARRPGNLIKPLVLLTSDENFHTWVHHMQAMTRHRHVRLYLRRCAEKVGSGGLSYRQMIETVLMTHDLVLRDVEPHRGGHTVYSTVDLSDSVLRRAVNRHLPDELQQWPTDRMAKLLDPGMEKLWGLVRNSSLQDAMMDYLGAYVVWYLLPFTSSSLTRHLMEDAGHPAQLKSYQLERCLDLVSHTAPLVPWMAISEMISESARRRGLRILQESKRSIVAKIEELDKSSAAIFERLVAPGAICLTPAQKTRPDGLNAPIKDNVVYSPYPPVELLPDESFYQHIQKRFLQLGDQPALERRGTWLSFEEVLALMERYASGFQRLGVSSGCRVCVNVSNSAESLVATYALCCLGAAVVLVKPTLTEREVLYQVQDSGATFIVTEKESVKKILSIHQICHFKGLFCMESVEGLHCVEDFEEEDASSFDEPFIDDAKTHITLYTYTSGTTGLPKGVEVSVYALIASLELCRAGEIFFDGEVFLAWNPVSHASGFLIPAAAFCCGAKVVPSSGGLCARDFVDIVNKHKVTSLCAFPTAFRKLVFELEEDLVPSLKRILLCGTVTTDDLYQRILQVFTLESLRNGYGLSETIGFVCITEPETIGHRSVGLPLPMVEYKIVDSEHGVALGPGDVGEITFRAPSLMRGYHNKPEATAEVIDQYGWFSSGDAGYYDSCGRLYVVERLKDMIKCLDQQVAPAEIESLLAQHPLVMEAAVVGIEHPDFGEAPTAFVVTAPSVQGCVTEEELKRLVAEQAASHKHLHGGVVFVDHIPKTDTGKYMRRMLRVQYRNKLG